VGSSVPAEELASALFSLVRGMSIKARGMPDLPFAMPRTDTILRLLRASAPPSKTGGARTGERRSRVAEAQPRARAAKPRRKEDERSCLEIVRGARIASDD
jgi:hypothetical protein